MEFRKIEMGKLLCLSRNLEPKKWQKNWIKNPKKWQKLGKIKPEFYRN